MSVAMKACEEQTTVGPPGACFTSREETSAPGSRAAVLCEANPVGSRFNSTNLKGCSALLSAGRKRIQAGVMVVNMSGLQRTMQGKLGPQSVARTRLQQGRSADGAARPLGGATLLSLVAVRSVTSHHNKQLCPLLEIPVSS